jgi:hypothetical protein
MYSRSKASCARTIWSIFTNNITLGNFSFFVPQSGVSWAGTVSVAWSSAYLWSSVRSSDPEGSYLCISLCLFGLHTKLVIDKDVGDPVITGWYMKWLPSVNGKVKYDVKFLVR